MKFPLSVSVVIVSQDRLGYLQNCLQALRYQSYTNFEVVVVADHLPDGFGRHVKFRPFSEKNISKARNIGLSEASGDIIAFCDDDAIPDQSWLERLIAPFEESKIGSTTGYTRGRNGISLQWGAMRFDRLGNDVALEMPSRNETTIFPPNLDCPLKLLGTNMAIRRTALVEVGGFDEAYSYYLDETDLKIRLDEKGWHCAVVPDAMVQHLSASSQHRKGNREIIDYSNIAASKAYFCKKHYADDPSKSLVEFAKRSGSSETQSGFEIGLKLIENYWNGDLTSKMFLPFVLHTGPHVVVFSGLFGKKFALRKTKELLDLSARVTILQLLPSVRYFQVKFISGYWLVRGGTYGKSQRSQPLFRFVSRRNRITQEIAQIHTNNPVDYVLFNQPGSFCHENPCLSPLKDHKVLEYHKM